ncbi:hypothetical protein CPB86DRAFT_186509 [Serendipita vermifera]|nr:hypothetical protein CPB86DRAFT_186509 [Serendipita vermifera]
MGARHSPTRRLVLAASRLVDLSGCTNKAPEGFKSCEDPVCRKIELDRLQPEKVMFQLKERLAYQRRRVLDSDTLTMDPLLRVAMSGGLDAADQVDSDLEDETDVEEPVQASQPTQAYKGKESSLGKGRKVKAFFGRRRTHNEELAVMSCGVIIGRATFYGSEAPVSRPFGVHCFPGVNGNGLNL